MQRTLVRKSHRLFFAAAGLIGLSLILASRGGEGVRAQQKPEPSPPREQAPLSLVDYFEVAEAHRPLAHIGFDDPADLAFLSAGWHPLEQGGGAWTKTRDAVVDVPIVSPQDMTVALTLGTHPAALEQDDLPVQTAEILWNGQSMGVYEIAQTSQQVEFRVPAANQHCGLNRMEILPLYWFVPKAVHFSDDTRSLGLRCSGIGFAPDRAEYCGGAEAAKVEGQSIVQFPGSVISYFFVLPENAVLRAKGILHGGNNDLPEGVAGRVIVSLTEAQVQSRVLFEGELGGLAPGFSIDEDLSAFAGQMVAVNLSFSLTTPAPLTRTQEAGLPILDSSTWARPEQEGFRFGLSHPVIADGLVQIESTEDLGIKGWITTNEPLEVRVTFNGAECEIKPEKRPDIEAKHPGFAIHAGFSGLIPGQTLETQNELQFFVDGDLQTELKFRLPERPQPEGGQDPPWHEALQLEWQQPRIEGFRDVLPEEGVEKFRGAYNVLIILFDALRSDFTEPYGSTEVRTPNMAGLASEGSMFVNMFANSSFTKTSVASLLTSLYPLAHNALTKTDLLSKTVPYLPEILREQGYKTIAVSKNGMFSPAFGFDRGFDEFHKLWSDKLEDGKRLSDYGDPTDRAKLTWEQCMAPFLKATPDQPFFAYIHEIDPHHPYEPPPDYYAIYDFGYDGNITSSKDLVALINRGIISLDDNDVRHIRAEYKGEITFMDAYLRWLLDKLEQEGLDENTLVLFLSDHGQAFMEHGRLTHGETMFEEVLRVPMIWRLKGVLPEGRRLEVNAEHVDIPPTIFDLLGKEGAEEFQGRSLLPFLLAPDEYAPDKPIYAKTMGHTECVRFRNWKLVIDSRDRAEDRLQLYDLDKDPGEVQNLWPRQPVTGRALYQMYNRQAGQSRKLRPASESAPSVDELPEDIKENLEAMGYLK